MIQMLLRSACGFIMLRYVFLKFLRVKLFLSGHELANSFLLFRVHKCFLQDKKYFLEACTVYIFNVNFNVVVILSVWNGLLFYICKLINFLIKWCYHKLLNCCLYAPPQLSDHSVSPFLPDITFLLNSINYAILKLM